MRLLLILTLAVPCYFSLPQLASAERWRGLIASVAAFESTKSKLETVPKKLFNTSTGEAVETIITKEKPVSPPVSSHKVRRPLLPRVRRLFRN